MASDNNSLVHYDIADGIARLTLDRPPLNVINIPMLDQLESALAVLSDDDSVRVLVLGAEGKLFSAGVDVADHTADKVGLMIPAMDHVCRLLAFFPAPTLAVVHGHALGGGLELVLCCDLAVMAEGATIGQPEIQLAAIAPIAALRLSYLTSYRTAADLVLTGRRMSAGEALQAGLVNAVVSKEELGSWVDQKAGQISSLSRAALRLAKRSLAMGFGDWTAKMPDMERLYLDELMNTADAHEGLAAFLEKRSPAWKHE
jgi:cyclohexa-1,5-dienecarbonyl-CoA hydratase